MLYVSKFPPSRSGIARYARQFRDVLARVGHVETLTTGHEASETSTLARIVRVVTTVHYQLRRRPDWVVVEVSGRAIAELLACASILGRRHRPRLWITAHDAPALTGGLFWVPSLDRKGLRRLAAFLSRTVGRRLERWTLEHADVVVCLSQIGARALAAEFSLTRTVRSIHAVADISPGITERHQMFLPGPLDPDSAIAVIDAIPDSRELDIVIGLCDEPTARVLRARAEACGLGARTRFAGPLSQKGLTELYRSSLIVVHWRAAQPRAKRENSAACSYPVIDAMAGGCALVTNVARGAREYITESAAAIDLANTPERLRGALADLILEPDAAARLGKRAFDYATATLSVEAVADEVAEILRQ